MPLIGLSEKYRKKGEYVIHQVEEDYLLIPVNQDAVELDTAYVLSETGAYIFNLLDGNHSVSEITDRLTNEFEVNRKEASEDVKTFIESIKERFLE